MPDLTAQLPDRRRRSLAVRRRTRPVPPASIWGELADSARSRASNAYYGLSHFGVDCLAHEVGQRKLMQFVTLKFRRDHTYDEAFGSPFRRVRTVCVRWIKQNA